ncbi:MAG: HIT family protein [Leptothrix ochracea]|uniref:HIT family protein n=1 Tax=Leptothrix ochracea TaxID=735331 RepID=UPI0034E20473
MKQGGDAVRCELCVAEPTPAAWLLVAQDARLRVIRVLDAPEFPAFYRVIWTAHVAEFSDLGEADRQHCMAVVVAVERVLREALQPTKINLATLGNVVPHLHWHVIARFDWDSHFPQPVWGERQRTSSVQDLAWLNAGLANVDERLRIAMDALASF